MNLEQDLADAISRDERDRIAVLLRRLLTGDKLPVVQWHPLGFIDILLHRDRASALRQRERATIHVWHPRLSRPQLPRHTCHSHGWHLRSHVLYGQFHNETYEVTSVPGGDHLLYEVSYESGVSRSMSTDERVTVRLTETELLQAGIVYEIPHYAYHWTRPDDDDLVITAMVGSALSGQPPRNVRAMPCQSEYTYSRAAVSESERRQIFDDILDRIIE
jgi:hypothetical protein